MNNDKKLLKFISFIYPYILYHLLFLWSWFTWARLPLEVSVYAVIIIIIIAEYFLFYALRRGETGAAKFVSFIAGTFFLLLPLIFIIGSFQNRAYLWIRWYVAFFYINHAVFLDYELIGMLLLGFASVIVAVLCYFFVIKRPKVIFGLYLPWLVFMLPLLFKYIIGGAFTEDIKQYGYIEAVVDPLKEMGSSKWAPPAPRGVYIENDKLYTAYETTVHASFAEKLLFIYDMGAKKISTIQLAGTGVRRIFSRPSDPYLYVVIWKWNPGFFRVNKGELNKMECLLDLQRSSLASKNFDKLYQIGNIYLDAAGKIAYLIPDPYPAVGKFWLDSRSVSILDLHDESFCPAGSILGFMPSVDQEERYMYLSLTNCFCGVVKIDMQRLDVAGCYEIEDPRKGFYGVTIYRDGQIIAFPVVKYYKTAVLNAENMRLVKEYDKPPFNFIRDVIELDSDNLLCLGFFGDLAIFNAKTGRYTTLIRKDLSLAMGLFKYGDHIYFNTAQHGILRIKTDDLLRRIESN